MKDFNGEFVKPTKLGGGKYLVNLPARAGEDETQLVCHEKNIVVTKDHATLAKMEFEERNNSNATTHTSTGNNRSNVGLATQALSSQIRGAIRREAKRRGGNKDGVQAVFQTFDMDDDGTINKMEFEAGCRKLKVLISSTEIDLIW
jgi:hypothetical protein